MEQQKLTYYLEGYAKGTLSAEEQEVLRGMLLDPANEEALNRLLDADWPRWEESDLQFPEGFARVQQGVRERVKAERLAGEGTIGDGVTAGRLTDDELTTGNGKVRRMRRVWAAAAAVVVLLGGVYLWRGRTDRISDVAESLPVAVDIEPGKQGAILTLADGSQVSLDSIQNGSIVLQQGAQQATAKVQNGVLVYNGAANVSGYNTISTPKGRIFHLELPDGTRVWLNSASTVRYPLSFEGDAREVDVTGEAYFEVATDKQRPFKLMVGHKAAVEVLGTRFNVNGYDNESKVTATLLDGGIKVLKTGLGAGGQGSVVLKPGQQAQLSSNKEGRIAVINDADIDKAMAWKNGLFNFEGLTLEEVMRQCERWYDVEVVYEKGIPEMELAGKMTKDVTLSQLLEGLKMFNVHYRLDGRRLIILP